MAPIDEGTKVTIVTDLKISGKVAQFGRGVIGDVSKKLIGQFVECIEAKLEHDGTSPEEAIEQVATASAAMSAAPVADIEEQVVRPPVAASAAAAGATTDDAAQEGAGKVEAGGEAAPTSRTFDEPEEELEALDLVGAAGGAVFKRFVPLLVIIAAILLIIWLVTRG